VFLGAKLTGLFQRELVRDPGPGTFVSSCAVFTLCLAHLMQHTSHHQYQNTFILCGAVCGILIGVLTGVQDTILEGALTAYLPTSIIAAQILSLLLHTMLSSWRDLDPCQHGKTDQAANSEWRKASICE
jgi:xanthine/uracil permease